MNILSNVNYVGDIVNLFGFSILGFGILALISKKSLEVPFGDLDMIRFKPFFVTLPLTINILLLVPLVIDRDYVSFGIYIKYIFSGGLIIYFLVVGIVLIKLISPVLNVSEFEKDKKKLVLKSIKSLNVADLSATVNDICNSDDIKYPDWIIDASSILISSFDLSTNLQKELAIKLYNILFDEYNIEKYLISVAGYTKAKPSIIDNLFDGLEGYENQILKKKSVLKILEFLLQQQTDVVSMYTDKSFTKNLNISRDIIGDNTFVDIIRNSGRLEYSIVHKILFYFNSVKFQSLTPSNTMYVNTIIGCFNKVQLSKHNIEELQLNDVIQSAYNIILQSESRCEM